MTTTYLSFDEVTDRDLFALEIESFSQQMLNLELPSPYFVCLLASDFRQASDSQVRRLASGLLKSGACYFVCWGPGCKRAHDLVDEAINSLQPNPSDTNVIMTTWHEGESLDDALFMFLRVCWPADLYIDKARSAVAITIQDGGISEPVRDALEDPFAFVQRTLDQSDV